MGEPKRGVLKGRGTAIEAFADGFRAELRDRVSGQLKAAEGVAARWLKLARGQSRTCLAICDGSGTPTELNEGGARVRATELSRLQREISNEPQIRDVCAA